MVSLRAIIYLLAIVVLSTTTFAADPILPDPKLTPGAVLTTDSAAICQPGYARSVRHTSGSLKHRVYVEYGIAQSTGRYEIDHLIPLGIGGADTVENLWPESRSTKPWNAGMKDRLENYLHVEVCSGHIAVADAQKAVTANWIAAYRKYIGGP
jgi:hypothetical protein